MTHRCIDIMNSITNKSEDIAGGRTIKVERKRDRKAKREDRQKIKHPSCIDFCIKTAIGCQKGRIEKSGIIKGIGHNIGILQQGAYGKKHHEIVNRDDQKVEKFE